MTRPFKLFLLSLLILLTGCLLTDDPVVGPDEAQETPSLAGHWKSADGDIELFLRANQNRSYSAGWSIDKLDQTWRVMNLEVGDYVAEVRTEEGTDEQGRLLIFSLSRNHLFFMPDSDLSLIEQAATQAGVQLKVYRKFVLIQPNQPKEVIVAMLTQLNELMGSHDKEPLIRQGGFIEPGGEENSIAAMKQLLVRGETAAAIEMGRYLSDRGDVKAQLALMNLATSRNFDRAEGILHGLRAVSSANTSGEEELADLYARPKTSGTVIEKPDIDAALYWLSTAQLKQPSANISNKIRKLSHITCTQHHTSATPACPENISNTWKMRASVMEKFQDTLVEIANVFISIEKKKSEERQLLQEQNELMREKLELEEKLAIAILHEGEKYALGQGVAVDHPKAVELFRKSADYGNAEAQYKLGWMLEKGMGTPQDEAEALTWYLKAATQDHSMAANNLAGLYSEGRGTQADPQQGFLWYQKAAELGLAYGHFNIGVAYRDAIGVEQSLELARKHFQIAQRDGVAEAAKQLSDIERRLARASANPLPPCGETPQKFREHSFGTLLYSLSEGCMHTMSEREQTFTAGMAQYFVERCSHPSDAQKRGRLQDFLTSSALVAAGGRQYSNPNPLAAVGDQLENASFFALGTKTADAIGCNAMSDGLAANIVAYLDHTALGEPDKPGYVDGCIARYAGQYSRAQCECVANLGRSVFPNIHRQDFSPDSIKAILHSNPLLGLQLMLQCGIVEY